MKKLIFVERKTDGDPGKDQTDIVASVDENGKWTGNTKQVASVKSLLASIELDAAKPGDWDQIVLRVSGSYFWSAINQTAQKEHVGVGTAAVLRFRKSAG